MGASDAAWGMWVARQVRESGGGGERQRPRRGSILRHRSLTTSAPRQTTPLTKSSIMGRGARKGAHGP